MPSIRICVENYTDLRTGDLVRPKFCFITLFPHLNKMEWARDNLSTWHQNSSGTIIEILHPSLLPSDVMQTLWIKVLTSGATGWCMADKVELLSKRAQIWKFVND